MTRGLLMGCWWGYLGEWVGGKGEGLGKVVQDSGATCMLWPLHHLDWHDPSSLYMCVSVSVHLTDVRK